MTGVHITEESARADIAELEWQLSFGVDLETACARVGLHPRTIMRRYEFLGRTDWPAGLSTLKQQKKVAT